MASNNIKIATPAAQPRCPDFDLTPEMIRASNDKEDGLRSVNALRASVDKKSKSNSPDAPVPDEYRTKLKAARDLMFNLRKDLHKHVARPGFKDLQEIQDLREMFEDFFVRVDTCNTSKPAKKFGPLDEVPHAKVEVVNSITGVGDLLVSIGMLENLYSPTPHIFINCTGDNLGRDGKMTSLAIYIPEAEIVYSVDLQKLGSEALTVSSTSQHISLKGVLENKSIAKGVWDCRSISDALWAEFGVLLDGVAEVQLLEIASGRIIKKNMGRENVPRLPGLETAFESRLNVEEDEGVRIRAIESFRKAMAEGGRAEAERAFIAARDVDPAKMKEWLRCTDGDLFEAMVKRSLVQKVLLLPALYHYLINHPKYTSGWEERVVQETEKRLELSRSPEWKEVDPMEPPSNWKPCDQLKSPKSSTPGSSEEEFPPTPSSTERSE